MGGKINLKDLLTFSRITLPFLGMSSHNETVLSPERSSLLKMMDEDTQQSLWYILKATESCLTHCYVTRRL